MRHLAFVPLMIGHARDISGKKKSGKGWLPFAAFFFWIGEAGCGGLFGELVEVEIQVEDVDSGFAEDA
jgi:hypothetical protein